MLAQALPRVSRRVFTYGVSLDADFIVRTLPADGEAKEFTLGEKVVCIANLGGEYSALDNVCAHQGGPLGMGVVLDGKVVCPWHGFEYNIKTGVHPGRRSARLVRVTVEETADGIYVTV